MTAEPELTAEDGPSVGRWIGDVHDLRFDPAGRVHVLQDLAHPCHVVRLDGRLGVTSSGRVSPASASAGPTVLATDHPAPAERLGSPRFRARHGVRAAYMAGAMAHGIASEALVIALGRAGLLGIFGAAGLSLDRIDAAIGRIQRELPVGPYGFNLIHSLDDPGHEHALVDLYLRRRVPLIEASAFMELPSAVVAFRAAGLTSGPDGTIHAATRVIAKVSRAGTARAFMSPPPPELLRELVAAGRISHAQAVLAAELPVAEDVTVEADSGGHTDRQPLIAMLPAILALRDRLRVQHPRREAVRIGAAGGIGTPAAAAGAFAMGADYVVTGSINQACVEAGTSSSVKAMLAAADPTDVLMAPSADMFELGVQVQVLRASTLFALRARKLREVYDRHDDLESIPPAERARLERDLFRKDLGEVWRDTRTWLAAHDPVALAAAERDPKARLAAVLRAYLGLSSRWAIDGTPGREVDYQVWCGPAMGAFNVWAEDTAFARPGARRVADVARALLDGAAWQLRAQRLALQGVHLGPARPATAPDAPGEHEVPDADDIADWLTHACAAELGTSADLVDVDQPFSELSFTSSQAVALLSRLERRLARRLSPTLLWNYPTIRLLAGRLGESEAS